MGKVTNNDSTPLYSRLESVIRNQILRGQLEPNEKIPSETELIEKFGVSRITVRKALSNLESEGLIVRQRAKGTFVSDNITVKKQFIFTGNMNDILHDTKRYKVKSLGIDVIKVSECRTARDIRTFLDLSNDDEIGWVRRLRSLDGVPIYYKENFLPTKYVKHLSMEELTKETRIAILRKKTDYDIGRGEFFIEAVPADADVADILGAKIFEPLIFIQIHYWLPSGEPSDLVNLFIKADYFRYKVELSKGNFINI